LVQAEDRSGVLQRVTNCLARRGFRLLSCTICQGPTSGLLSIWLRVGTGPQPYDQVTKQLAKLIDVVSVEDLTEQDPLQWVTALVEIRKVGDARDLELALDRPGVQVVRRLESSVLAAVSGPPEEVGESMRRLRQLPLVDWVVGRPLALAQHKTVPATANSKQTMSGS
jgi:acetolactate synthase-1/3 small subunit